MLEAAEEIAILRALLRPFSKTKLASTVHYERARDYFTQGSTNMTWNDDSWRDGYDAWKLASPEEDGPEEDYCDHDHYSIDILSGRAECDQCPHSWYVTEGQIRQEIERQAAYDEYLERENRRQWWCDLFAPILDPIDSLRWKLRRLSWRWRRAPIIDDDIPF